MLVALLAVVLVREDFEDSSEGDEDVDDSHETGWQVVAETETKYLESPVKTSDNEENKSDFMKFHTLN